MNIKSFDVMRSKRAQVTIFVIIALVIALGIGVYYFLKEDSSRGDSEIVQIPIEAEPVDAFIRSCIRESVSPSVYLIGQGGGYAYPPFGLSDVDGFTYYFRDGNVYLPGMNKIKENLEKTVEGDVLVCVDSFKNFSDREVSSGKIDVNAEILPEKVVFTVTYPVSVKMGEKTVFLESFGEYEVEEKLGKIYSIVEALVDEGFYDDSFICLSCISDAAYENNLTIDFLEGSEYGSVFVLKDAVNPVNSGENTYYDDETNDEEVFKFIFASD